MACWTWEIWAPLLAGGQVQFLEELDKSAEWHARKTLLRGATPKAPQDLG